LLQCSSVLIAPRLVLTAGHCLIGNPLSYRVVFDSPVLADVPAWGVLDARWSPEFDPVELRGDLALVLLDRDAPVEPLRVAPASDDAATFSLVGFGGDRYPPFQRTSGAVAALGSDPATGLRRLDPAPAQACHGDSGAPILAHDEQVAAIVSRGPAQCDGSFGATPLTTAQLAWIDDYVRDVSSEVEAGGRCWTDEQCLDGECWAPDDAPARRYCAPACDPLQPCPEPMSCEPDTGRCRLPAPSPGALGTACTRQWDCGVGVCGRPLGTAQPPTCMLPCAGLDLGCPDANRCVPAELMGSPSPVRNVCVP
jgi:hypothetical protein